MIFFAQSLCECSVVKVWNQWGTSDEPYTCPTGPDSQVHHSGHGKENTGAQYPQHVNFGIFYILVFPTMQHSVQIITCTFLSLKYSLRFSAQFSILYIAAFS